MKKLISSACSLLVIASAGHAQVFFDNFNSDVTGIGKTATNNWTVLAGNVDVIGSSPSLFDFYPGNGNYVDLDGTNSGVAPVFRSNSDLTLLAGQSYTLSFSWGRNGNSAEQATVSLLNSSFAGATITYPGGGPSPLNFASYTFTQATTVNNVRIQFAQQTPPDGGGIVIDNVQLASSTAPEPTSVALMGLLGAPLLGLLRRRK